MQTISQFGLNIQLSVRNLDSTFRARLRCFFANPIVDADAAAAFDVPANYVLS